LFVAMFVRTTDQVGTGTAYRTNCEPTGHWTTHDGEDTKLTWIGKKKDNEEELMT
jgi:hypothetical protein